MPKCKKELFKPEDKLPHYATACEKAEPKNKKSKELIKLGISPAQLKELIRICNAAVGFAEERGLGDLEDMAESWKKGFKIVLKTHKKEGECPKKKTNLE